MIDGRSYREGLPWVGKWSITYCMNINGAVERDMGSKGLRGRGDRDRLRPRVYLCQYSPRYSMGEMVKVLQAMSAEKIFEMFSEVGESCGAESSGRILRQTRGRQSHGGSYQEVYSVSAARGKDSQVVSL